MNNIKISISEFKHLIIITILSVLILIIGILLYKLFWIYFYPTFSLSQEEMFEQKLLLYESDRIPKSIANLCLLESSEFSQIICVYSMIDNSLIRGYKDRIKKISNDLNTPEEIMSGVPSLCRDSSLLVCATAINMGFKCNLHIVPGHMYSIIDGNDWKCELDLALQKIKCLYKK